MMSIMTNDEADEFIKELFDSLINTYQNNLIKLNLIKFESWWIIH